MTPVKNQTGTPKQLHFYSKEMMECGGKTGGPKLHITYSNVKNLRIQPPSLITLHIFVYFTDLRLPGYFSYLSLSVSAFPVSYVKLIDSA